MQNKLFAILITALLVLMMSGSAMCATYDDKVMLVEKEDFGEFGNWSVVEGGASAEVWYNYDGDDFEWRLQAKGLNAETRYHLIYYADYDPLRFTNCGGDNPGACLGTFDVLNNGTVVLNNQVTELDINMPELPDYNIAPNPWDEYCNKSGRDAYDRCCGAKLQIVPCSDYNTEAKKLTGWNPADYLFETDLIWYDNTGHNITPEIIGVDTDNNDYQAGDIVNITVKVRDYDGVGDLTNMIVDADFGGNIPEVLTLDGIINCTCAEYSGSGVVTNAGEEICVEVNATDPSGESVSMEVCFNVVPGECIIVIEGPDKAFTHGIVYLDVYCEDEYGNALSCCSDFASSIIGDASHYADWDDSTCSGYIQVVDYGIPGEVVVKACCLCDGERKIETHNITFMNQIGGLDLTADPEFVYNISECGDPDCTDVSAQLIDEYGEHVPMPGIFITFTIEGDSANSTDVETDDNGTATINVCMETGYSDSIFVVAQTRCITEPIDIDILENVLYEVKLQAPGNMMCGDKQPLNYTCKTDHDTEMCCSVCPPAEWECTGPGTVNETDYFTALDSGVVVVEVNVSGVTDMAEIVINCSGNCVYPSENLCCDPEPFVVTSGSVELTGNFTCEVYGFECDNDGWACIEAIGKPIPGWDNVTRGAIVNVSESDTANVTLDLGGEGDTWIYNETSGKWSKYADGSVAEVSNGTYALVIPPFDPCDGVECEDDCIGVDLWSYVCDEGNCVPDEMIEENCTECGYNPCDGVVCDSIVCVDGNCCNMTCVGGECVDYMMVEECNDTTCNGTDLYNMTCVDGNCTEYMLIEANCAECGYVEPTPTPTYRRGGGGGGGTYPPDPTPTPDVDDSNDNETDQDDPKPAATKPADAKPTVNLPGGDTTLDTTPDDEDDAPGGADPTNAILVVLGILALLVIGYVLYRKSQN